MTMTIERVTTFMGLDVLVAKDALSPDDFDLGRIQLKEPTPIPESEARWAWDWRASWGVLHGPFDATTQINRKAEREAHERASAVLAG